MHILLSKLLHKRGIENIKDLSPEEKDWFDQKQSILSQPEEVKIEDFKKFCESQIGLIEEQWKNLDNSTQKNERLIILHSVYSTIIKAIISPKAERQALEEYLQKLLYA